MIELYQQHQIQHQRLNIKYQYLYDLLKKANELQIDKKDLKDKTFSVKELWTQVQTDEQYKQLPSRDKRNMYGRDAFYQFLNENYKIETDYKGTKKIIGLRKIEEDDEIEEDDDV